MHILGLDIDPGMIETAEEEFADKIEEQRLFLGNSNFTNIPDLSPQGMFNSELPRLWHSVLLDLGYS